MQSQRALKESCALTWLLRGPLPVQGLATLVSEYGNVLEGHCCRVLEAHPRGVRMLATLPGLLAGSDYNVICVWNATTWTLVHTLKGHTREIMSLVTMSSHLLASGSADHTVRVWDTSIGACVHMFETRNYVCVLAAYPGGNLVIGTGDILQLWNFETRETCTRFVGHTKTVYAIALLPAHRLASGSRDATVRVWDVPSGQCVHHLQGHRRHVHTLVALPDDQLASGSGDRTVRVWDTVAGVCLWTLDGHAGSVSVLAFNSKLISGSSDKTVRVWDLATGTCLHQLTARHALKNMVVMPGGLLASCSDAKEMQVWDLHAGALFLELFGHTDSVMSAILLPDGTLASASLDHTVRVWG